MLGRVAFGFEGVALVTPWGCFWGLLGRMLSTCQSSRNNSHVMWFLYVGHIVVASVMWNTCNVPGDLHMCMRGEIARFFHQCTSNRLCFGLSMFE